MGPHHLLAAAYAGLLGVLATATRALLSDGGRQRRVDADREAARRWTAQQRDAKRLAPAHLRTPRCRVPAPRRECATSSSRDVDEP